MRASNDHFLIWILCALCLSSSLSSGFTPDDNFLIDCGSSSNSTVGDRLFISDDFSSNILSNPNGKSLSTTSNVSSSSPLFLFSSLLRTAKIFETTSKYNFKIKKQGRHWIRLYFYPFVSGNMDLSLARFSVSAQNITLLKEFQMDSGSVIKEYSLNVTSSNLVLTFTPMVNSFAFINALEVVSVPNELIPSSVPTVEKLVRSLGNRALETVARVNMGNETVSPNDDTLSRLWVADGPFLMHNDQVIVGKFVSNLTKVNMTRDSEIMAPRSVYGTATQLGADADANANVNVSWSFDVDPGYEYLIRYHFCDIIDLSLRSLSFNVYVNSWKVKDHLDIGKLTSGILGAPYVLDTIASPIDSSKFKISVGPSNFHEYSAAILNGLEIMKISNSRGSLDEPSFDLDSKKVSNVKVGLIAGLVAGLLVAAVLATLVIVLCRRRRRLALVRHSKEEDNYGVNGRESKYIIGSVGFSSSKIGYRYPLAAILEATDHFSESLAIGLGGFGKVYKGMLRDNTEVAVKRGTSKSQQGLAEFRTEIEMLSQFRHRHLVSLIGYCDEQDEMIIIYEYMEKGTLKDHLYGSELPSLSWKQRLEVCIGSARGLHYLHTGSTKAIIHRDVKTANILLDQNYMAKVADFGLSKIGPEFDKTHVSTAVKGSFGYLDPEYLTTQQLTEKSDVYSFGVVMFEILCGRPVIDPSLPREKVNLIEWVMRKGRDQLEAIVDACIVEEVELESLRKYVETADKCLAECGMDRPTMGNILWNLECALQLQGNERSLHLKESSSQADLSNSWEASVSTTQFSTGSAVDIAGVSMSKVFAQMVREDMR
ncbi:probable receptor-like protein kinase At2g39360 [Cucurbita maxima]|uniref:Probable receptor-like protein kinase At2g39360 n=1 Tax=Cucurbita maxima TaxID=3661 RepID=A0A6J1JEN0_CUCMA|nr:probable receptor-like protein kinase At2g39360 [Cucurbita maxima]